MGNQYERREIPTEAKKLEYLTNKNQFAPENEFEALMMALPMNEPEDVYSVSPLRQAVMDCIDALEPRDKYVIDAIYSERITYDELGARLGYKPQKSGSPQAFMVTKAALSHLKDLCMENDVIKTFIYGNEDLRGGGYD